MKIASVHTRVEHFELTRPYAIAFRSVDSVQNFIVALRSDRGCVGLGAASPEPHVTGETPEACGEALREDQLAWLVGADVRALPVHCRELGRRMPHAPAARAALDMALHDLLAQYLGLPLVEMLGRAHESLPTSITIGIKSVDETLREAREYLERGFRVLKVKLGHSMDEDIERLRALRRSCGGEITLRVDANQGYEPDAIMRFVDATRDLDIEFMEQPVPVAGFYSLGALPDAVRKRIAADESLLEERDAVRLLEPPRPCGILNIKLMKCGGVHAGLRIATIAEAAGLELMWGCMDESLISISAALHAALASPATRYLDLDGSLDLARDVVEGGLILENGTMRTTDASGLGVKLID
ncbi:MAG: dipeptide epimerase [Gammaproteobacteria bacterium]|nr:dipeptide epimerase [Gammaproteobacteria bacterium]NIR83441.1 dipeptide epimerase [Gammaproteobacteria bacterium]NIR91363.1 dipeptide epimerase [Gammaproteobacteria bacterium]NIU04603.1 dipeptide epimerase [Gammaproteobacteria bacterium]NIV51645.1 dipeptide epimerase [Gammaproteobacteria bacterium]